LPQSRDWFSGGVHELAREAVRKGFEDEEAEKC
jgi:hypothetical protein